jgi:hypothetical protein
MNIREATRAFERWAGEHITLVPSDLARKHLLLGESPFVFLRGTFYRWLQIWPEICARLADAPVIACVGDLHIENFGTWRDTEGRLVWGVNDFDETCRLPYTNDLVRLATSALLASTEERLSITARELSDAILEGYTRSLERGGRPLVLAERGRWLRRIALNDLRDPLTFWPKLEAGRAAVGRIPHALFRAAMPAPKLPYRVVRRVAGVGSLGRQRFVALANWNSALVAREAKAWLPSAAVFVTGRMSAGFDAATLLTRVVRAPDPTLRIGDGWIVRRLAPDCSRVELEQLPRSRDEERLLATMGWEIANVHVNPGRARILTDLKKRPRRWLERAAIDMAGAVRRDCRDWNK